MTDGRGRGLIDLTGKRFERLTVIARHPTRRKGAARWVCDCVCGEQVTAASSNLLSGDVRSCGCLRKELARIQKTTHGSYKSAERNIWQQMIGRCHGTPKEARKNYGDRGISVCEAWRADFLNFLRDVGPRPSPKHSLDRYPDNDGNYEPGNVRWATKAQQGRNTRASGLISIDGVMISLRDAIEQSGLSYRCVYSRLRDYGYSLHNALEIDASRSVEWVRRLKERLPIEETKIAARQAVHNAIRSGKMVRARCEVCGNPNAQAHHQDYARPLDVLWLCSKHHGATRRKEAA